MGVHGGVCLVLNTHERPCVVTDAATIEGSISMRCDRTATIEGFLFRLGVNP